MPLPPIISLHPHPEQNRFSPRERQLAACVSGILVLRLDVRFVVRAHRAQRTHLMIGELVVGVAMLGAEYASGPRVASRRAVCFDFDAMGQALWDIPSRVDTH